MNENRSGTMNFNPIHLSNQYLGNILLDPWLRHLNHAYDIVDTLHNTLAYPGANMSWHQGTLGCCGAYQKFHRHGLGDEVVDPEKCYRGPHEANPNRVVCSASIWVMIVKGCTEWRNDWSDHNYKHSECSDWVELQRTHLPQNVH